MATEWKIKRTLPDGSTSWYDGMKLSKIDGKWSCDPSWITDEKAAKSWDHKGAAMIWSIRFKMAEPGSTFEYLGEP